MINTHVFQHQGFLFSNKKLFFKHIWIRLLKRFLILHRSFIMETMKAGRILIFLVLLAEAQAFLFRSRFPKKRKVEDTRRTKPRFTEQSKSFFFAYITFLINVLEDTSQPLISMLPCWGNNAAAGMYLIAGPRSISPIGWLPPTCYISFLKLWILYYKKATSKWTFYPIYTKRLSDQILASFVYYWMNTSNSPNIQTAWGLVNKPVSFSNIFTIPWCFASFVKTVPNMRGSEKGKRDLASFLLSESMEKTRSWKRGKTRK